MDAWLDEKNDSRHQWMTGCWDQVIYVSMIEGMICSLINPQGNLWLSPSPHQCLSTPI